MTCIYYDYDSKTIYTDSFASYGDELSMPRDKIIKRNDGVVFALCGDTPIVSLAMEKYPDLPNGRYSGVIVDDGNVYYVYSNEYFSGNEDISTHNSAVKSLATQSEAFGSGAILFQGLLADYLLSNSSHNVEQGTIAYKPISSGTLRDIMRVVCLLSPTCGGDVQEYHVGDLQPPLFTSVGVVHYKAKG